MSCVFNSARSRIWLIWTAVVVPKRFVPRRERAAELCYALTWIQDSVSRVQVTERVPI